MDGLLAAEKAQHEKRITKFLFSFCCASRSLAGSRERAKKEKLERSSSNARLASTFRLFFLSTSPHRPPPPRADMNCALKPSPRVTRSSGSAFANGGNSLAAPMRALSVASTSASRRPLTVEGRRATRT